MRVRDIFGMINAQTEMELYQLMGGIESCRQVSALEHSFKNVSADRWFLR